MGRKGRKKYKEKRWKMEEWKRSLTKSRRVPEVKGQCDKRRRSVVGDSR